MRDELKTMIIRALKNDKCVIVIGPDFKEFPEKSFFGAMKEHFLSQHADKYSKDIFFQTEEFIQPREGNDSLLIQETIGSFYEKQTHFDELLTKMSQIPFSLIISLMPDMRVERIFHDQEFLYDFNYYPVNSKRADIAERSTKYKPLIYNLLGDLSKYDAVFSFDTMFRFLANLFNDDLPYGVNLTLSQSTVFIFWGVRFERWHTQLVLKKIATQQTNGQSTNYTTNITGNESDIIVFIMERLKLSSVENIPEVFMTELYKACQEENIFRKPPHKVFISYSHDDKKVAMSVADILKSKYVNVTIDEESIRTTEKIRDFIKKIGDVDIVMPIISKNSLFSPYVFKEIKTGNSMHKKIFPCRLDDLLFSEDIRKHMDNHIGERIKSIRNGYENRMDDLPSDLQSEDKLWNEFKKSFPGIIRQLKNMHVELVDQDNIPGTVQKIIDDWNNEG